MLLTKRHSDPVLSKPGHVKYRRHRHRRRARRFFLILLGAVIVMGVLFWITYQLNQWVASPPPTPPVPDDASVQFK